MLTLRLTPLLSCALLTACVPISEPIGETLDGTTATSEPEPVTDTGEPEPDTGEPEPDADTGETDTGEDTDTGEPEGPAPLACGLPEVCPTGSFYCDADPCEYDDSTFCVLARLEAGEVAELQSIALFEPGGDTLSTWVLLGDAARTVLVQHAYGNALEELPPGSRSEIMQCTLQPPDYFAACAAEEVDCFYVSQWVTDCAVVDPVCPSP